MTDTVIRIEPATAADAADVVAMLRERDQQPYEAGTVLNYLADLNPQRACVWLARQGQECLGINAVYLRSLATAQGELPAGYWAHLYVRPTARKLMIYPRLVLEMMRWSKDAGLRVVYTGSRQQHVATAHLRIGFERFTTLRVLIQPLRPATLVASRKMSWSSAALRIARGVDTAYRVACRGMALAGRQHPSITGPLSADAISDPVLEAFCSHESGKLCVIWEPEAWQRRFSATIEGDPYTCFFAGSPEQPEAGVLMRVAERGTPPVRVGVLMTIFDRSAGSRHLPALLAAVSRAADDAGCAGVIGVEQAAAPLAAAMRAQGYWPTAERYAIVAKAVGDSALPKDFTEASAWHFDFAEHDAF